MSAVRPPFAVLDNSMTPPKRRGMRLPRQVGATPGANTPRGKVDASPNLSIHEVSLFSVERPHREMVKGHFGGIVAIESAASPDESVTVVVQGMSPASSAATSTPSRKLIGNDTTIHSDHSRNSSPETLHPPTDDVAHRCILLEQQLAAVQQQMCNTSASFNEREAECIELNMFVEDMQKEFAANQKENIAKSQQLAELQKQVAQLNAKNEELSIECKARREAAVGLQEALKKVEQERDRHYSAACHFKKNHDAAAQEAIKLKTSLAQYQSVLDRLDLRPPFSEAMIGAAILRKQQLQPLRLQ